MELDIVQLVTAWIHNLYNEVNAVNMLTGISFQTIAVILLGFIAIMNLKNKLWLILLVAALLIYFGWIVI